MRFTNIIFTALNATLFRLSINIKTLKLCYMFRSIRLSVGNCFQLKLSNCAHKLTRDIHETTNTGERTSMGHIIAARITSHWKTRGHTQKHETRILQRKDSVKLYVSNKSGSMNELRDELHRYVIVPKKYSVAVCVRMTKWFETCSTGFTLILIITVIVNKIASERVKIVKVNKSMQQDAEIQY
jgi:hypothetical protein